MASAETQGLQNGTPPLHLGTGESGDMRPDLHVVGTPVQQESERFSEPSAAELALMAGGAVTANLVMNVRRAEWWIENGDTLPTMGD